MRNREGGVCWAGKFRESAVPPNTCNPTIAKTIMNRNNNAAIDTKLDSELTRTDPEHRKCFPKVFPESVSVSDRVARISYGRTLGKTDATSAEFGKPIRRRTFPDDA